MLELSDQSYYKFLIPAFTISQAQRTGFNRSRSHFFIEDLRTIDSITKWRKWKDGGCQPNFWKDVSPDPATSCGPYRPKRAGFKESPSSSSLATASDTIGILSVDATGHVVAGTSTNGANHKIPGRVGDSPIPGSGAYADDEAGE